ncbi:MAG: hypothetical protein M3P44_07795 [Actinomycetota bacterium]|nr:hypothetical protein [Actinomycetota bacterium]
MAADVGKERGVVTDRDREIVEWVGRLGAARARDVMARFALGRSAAYRRLGVLVDVELLRPVRLLHARPALLVVTRDGLRFVGLGDYEVCHVVVASANHWAQCARVAVALERSEPGRRVRSERELRAVEIERGQAVASAQLGRLPDGRARLRRPDLVLTSRDGGLPIPIEVELSVKAPRRLEAICRAWARCRIVDGVRYYAPPHVARAVRRAADKVHATDAIDVRSLDELLRGEVRDDRLAA